MKHFSVLIATILFVGAVVLAVNRPVEAPVTLGDASDVFSYRSYTSSVASSTAGTVVKGGAGELGSVNITSATATAGIIIYDGATSATSGLSVIARFPATALGGSYNLNVSVVKGVVVELPGTFTGNITFGVR